MLTHDARKAPTKADCLILDVCDVSSRHKLSVLHLPAATSIAYSHSDQDELAPRAAHRTVHPLPVSEAVYRPTRVPTRAVDLVLKWETVVEARYKLALSEGTRLRGATGGWVYRWDRVQGWP